MGAALLAFLLFLLTAGAAAPTAPPADPPPTAGEAGAGGWTASGLPPAPPDADAIRAYRDSGRWDWDLARQVSRAMQSLATQLAERRPARPAIVLDVDDTALSAYACLDRVEFERDRVSCGSRTDLPAIEPTRTLAHFAQARGVAVHFITGRRERVRESTVENLRRAGYGGRWRLHMRPDRQPAARRDGWKARTRRALTRDGRTILLNVGDQRSDLDGGWARRTYKLPNPMYVIPTA